MSELGDKEQECINAVTTGFATMSSENIKLKARIKALEGVVELVKSRQEMLNTGRVGLQMFAADMRPGNIPFTPSEDSGTILVKRIQAVEKKMLQALKKLEEMEDANE